MAKTEDIKNVLAKQATTATAAIPADPAEIERRLKFLELQEKEEAYRLRQEAKDIQNAHRRANALQMESKRKKLEAEQRGCDHRKKNGETYLAGQRDHSGRLHLICQGCMKHFYGHEVPIHLRPEAERVGGPEVTSTAFEKIQPFYQAPADGGKGSMEVPLAVAAMQD